MRAWRGCSRRIALGLVWSLMTLGVIPREGVAQGATARSTDSLVRVLPDRDRTVFGAWAGFIGGLLVTSGLRDGNATVGLTAGSALAGAWLGRQQPVERWVERPAPGVLVRVTSADAAPLIGRVATLRSDSITIAGADGRRVALPRGVARMEVRDGRETHMRKWAMIYGLGGAVLGAAFASSQTSSCSGSCWINFSKEESATVGAAFVGVAGLLAGALHGATIGRTDRWVEAPTPSR